ALANNTAYGLAASVWSENIKRALEVSAQIKAGVVWVNTTYQFDAASGFGGYPESSFGRDGGNERMYEYLKHNAGWSSDSAVIASPKGKTSNVQTLDIDRTAKLYIGGKQARPDGGNTLPVLSHDGVLVGRVGEGNRKDIRNAVEAAFKNGAWTGAT